MSIPDIATLLGFGFVIGLLGVLCCGFSLMMSPMSGDSKANEKADESKSNEPEAKT